MDFISSKNIFLLVRDTLKLIDKRLMKHGSRTGYILYKMLETQGKFEKFELAEFVMLATLHDIGAYKTENINDLLIFETKITMQHSIYGYLFLKYLTPMENKAKVVLYHHVDYSMTQNMTYEFLEVAQLLNLAEKIDIYYSALKQDFKIEEFYKFADKKFSEEALRLFHNANEEHGILKMLESEEYEKQMDELMDYIMFTNFEKKRYIEMVMYCLSFRSEIKVIDSVTSIFVAQKIAQHLGIKEKEIEKLFYAALIHDIGMLSIPSELIESARKLNVKETEIVRTHIELAQKTLLNRMDEEIVKIAMRHHERLNGSGYPLGLKGHEMTILEMILQVSDTMTGLINERPFKKKSTKDEAIAELKHGVNDKLYHREVVGVLVDNYDEIMKSVEIEKEKILKVLDQIHQEYDRIYKKLSS